MFVSVSHPEGMVLIKYSDITRAYGELMKHNTLTRDNMRKEAADLLSCFTGSLETESLTIRTMQGKEKSLVVMEQVWPDGEYRECSPASLDMVDPDTLAFRIKMVVDVTPRECICIPAYVQMKPCNGRTEIKLSLSNDRSDRHAELYVPRCGGTERYGEVCEYIKGMMLQFIADQRSCDNWTSS
ncbi:TPA: hypothetical protein J1246_004474 [Escherichia coli]|nr:hypothetical protein [Escherichia coli]HBA8925058.1 hypothetical protein [Escherichia coli]